MMYQNKFIVAVKSQDGKILREDGDKVLIPFGQEYSLHFKNLNSQKAVISVEIDGQDVLNGRQLIIEPNRIISLERFIDDLETGNKFKFIKKTKEIQDHRGDFVDDGFIRITFQYEKPKEYFNSTFYRSESLSRGISYPSSPTSVGGGFSNTINTSSNSMSKSLSNSKAEREVVLDSLGDMNSQGLPLEDEGITVKGSVSNQSFKLGTVGTLEREKHVLILRLKGQTDSGKEIVEPVTVKTKLECETCGRKSDSKSKFCNNCGTSLI